MKTLEFIKEKDEIAKKLCKCCHLKYAVMLEASNPECPDARGWYVGYRKEGSMPYVWFWDGEQFTTWGNYEFWILDKQFELLRPLIDKKALIKRLVDLYDEPLSRYALRKQIAEERGEDAAKLLDEHENEGVYRACIEYALECYDNDPVLEDDTIISDAITWCNRMMLADDGCKPLGVGCFTDYAYRYLEEKYINKQ